MNSTIHRLTVHTIPFHVSHLCGDQDHSKDSARSCTGLQRSPDYLTVGDILLLAGFFAIP
jgi:hypothetical protein